MKVVYPFLIGIALAMPLQASIKDPDCTAEKAAKSTAAKMTVGVSGRCSPKEAAKDTATGAVSNALPDEGVAGKAVDAALPGSSSDNKGVKPNNQ
ncbi:hypothetical protein PTW35_14275 [Photobacterium sp. DA100]|uniref:hypothetical protein n=1 Tax=Photobacterium sp. DA100 TaxID=3027472 RepID=UPI00247ACB30|nr:hypothetical protein [Photobacterium sp. DA100]WEM41770.1 hypothetical protein PTW35_14275 [Photobacterium sp. DA100]